VRRQADGRQSESPKRGEEGLSAVGGSECQNLYPLENQRDTLTHADAHGAQRVATTRGV
jgi:hypothetical protein